MNQIPQLSSNNHPGTTKQYCVRCSTGDDLRCYFAQVGKTFTVTWATGSNAVLALLKMSL